MTTSRERAILDEILEEPAVSSRGQAKPGVSSA